MTFDGKAFGAEIVSVVKDYVQRQTEPLEARIRVLEAQARGEKSKPVVRVAAPSREHR